MNSGERPVEPAMFIKELWRYPVKSMAGERVTQIQVGELGFLRSSVLSVNFHFPQIRMGCKYRERWALFSVVVRIKSAGESLSRKAHRAEE